MFRITDTVKHLIIINVIILIGALTIGGGHLFLDWFAIYFPQNDLFKPWQIITHMFMHAGPDHLIGNMLLLFFFGVGLELAIGKSKFLFLYISAGLGATLLPMIIDYIHYIPLEQSLINDGLTKVQIKTMLTQNEILTTVTEAQKVKLQELFEIFHKRSLGASGAVMGVVTAFGFLFPNREFILLFPPIPVKVKYLVVGMVGADLISAFFMGSPLLAGNNTGYVAHVGGAATGLLMAWYWKKNQFNKNRWDR
ncbi:rhomboid family intramembrane serine protease [Psychroserpens sp. SPM9]|uniref:rhomboid family intramembrane serine protease n=1 Tax=Psychroserpens sp. SPM9 TaxID=2975598 RepID=UPI0021A80B15|nr:rhomboid family intramembrane serine protease [Psychroserpens sp. SPM9]MDG5491510.1 rhomboid family intramembrane serine protease [Psychroserpens sp. SPM9]